MFISPYLHKSVHSLRAQEMLPHTDENKRNALSLHLDHSDGNEQKLCPQKRGPQSYHIAC